MEEIDYKALRSYLDSAMQCFFERLSSETAIASICAIGLYVNEELGYVIPTANSGTMDSERGDNWLPADWEFHDFARDCFDKVESALLVGWSEDFSEYSVDRKVVLQILHEILWTFRSRYFSGTSTIVGIFVAGGMSGRIVHSSVKKLNPPHLYDLFSRQNPPFLP